MSTGLISKWRPAKRVPLFFLLTPTGTCAGTLWYIRRIANDRVDHQIARREAQELGLTDKGYWAAATDYVDRLGGPRTTATSGAAALSQPTRVSISPA